MQTIAILTGGSRGDVQPYIALGKGLKAAGYTVRLIASDDFEALVNEAGLIFCSIGLSVNALLQTEAWRAEVEGGNFITIMAKARTAMQQQMHATTPHILAALEGSDLMITGVAGFGGGFSFAEKFSIPVVQAHVFPITPTRDFPSPLTPNLPGGGVVNALSFRILRQILWQSTRAGDAETRRILEMPKPPFWGPFRQLEKNQVPTLYGYSRHVVPTPTDWDATHQVTGYWFLDEADDWQPPQDFVDFLASGSPPVYVGFGSMLNQDPAAVAATVLDALRLSGQRGVLSSGWGGLTRSDLPDGVYMIDSMPHSWLFPRMAGVVHHGGAGTTAAGLRAGVPTVIVPFMADQPFWGKRVHELGVGPQPIPRKTLTPERLAGAITAAMNDDTRQRAAALGHKIRAEEGVQGAVAAITQLLARSSGI